VLNVLAALLLSSTQADAPVTADGEVLVFGELHGSVEIPLYFLRQVQREVRRRPVTVGLEIGPSSALVDCRVGDPRRLPASWMRSAQDGRTSQAMRGLLCALRAPPLARRVRVVFLDDDVRGEDFDRRAAARFRSVLAARGGIGMILTGNFHARNNPGSLAAELRRSGAAVHTATVSAPAAETWLCSGDRGTCGPRRPNINFCSNGAAASREARWHAISDPRFQWDYCLSVPRLTPSLPAMADRADRALSLNLHAPVRREGNAGAAR
jgi:hypothetical protein